MDNNNILHQVNVLLDQVTDPEIPVLTIRDLGIVRDVQLDDQGRVEVSITPTYTGCPAMDVIAFDIRLKLAEAGCKDVQIKQVLQPSWTTDWMSESGKEKLKAYGIAPPEKKSSSRIGRMLFEEDAVSACPRCGSSDTVLLSNFGSTACKALYQCQQCKEPFDHFKCH
jgi:ring-1,2-phenylacetyl-CoA epoxidase subunit PaaD